MKLFNKFFITVSLSIITSVSAFAQAGIGSGLTPELDNTISGLKFTFADKTGYATIVGYYESLMDSVVTLPEFVTVEGTDYPIKAFSSDALKGCKKLKSINIPKGVTTLDANVFYECTSLKKVIFDDSDTELKISGTPDTYSGITSVFLFRFSPLESVYIGRNLTYSVSTATDADTKTVTPFYKRPLKEVTIGPLVTNLNNYLFNECSSFEKIIIPASVTNISTGVFHNCSSLKEVIFEDGESNLKLSTDNANYNYGQFKTCTSLNYVYIGRNMSYPSNDNLQNDNKSPFYKRTSLRTVIFGNTVTSVGPFLFLGCSNLRNLTISKSVNTVAKYAFNGCTEMENLYCLNEIPPTVNDYAFSSEIYSKAKLWVPYSSISEYKSAIYWRNFYNIGEVNSDMTEIDGLYYILDNQNLTATITYSRKHSLDNYNGYTELTIPESIDYMGNTYTIIGIGDEAFSYCWGLKSISLPESLTFLGNIAFGYCTSLRCISIPDGISVIGDEAFTGCSAMANVNIGNNVESIGNYAFFGCTGLSEISIPESVNKIGENAFMGVHWLNNVHSNSMIPSDAHSTSFSSTAYKTATLYVPAGTLEIYRAHPTWSKFLSITEEGTMDITEIESDQNGEVFGDNGAIDFRNVAPDTNVAIYSLDGSTIYLGQPKRLEVISGIYIVKIGNKTTKISIR